MEVRDREHGPLREDGGRCRTADRRRHPGRGLDAIERRPVVSRGLTTALGAVVTLVAAALCWYDLGDKELRLDEATSWFISGRDWAGLWEAVSTSEANAGLYYALLHLWLNLGESEVAIRALSVIFGVGTIPLAYMLGNRLFGRLPAFFGALLLGANAFFVENVQDARGYALATFLVTGASLVFVDLLWRPTTRWTVLYAVLGALALYAHFFSGLVLAAHLGSAAIARQRPVKHLAIAYGAIAVAIMPAIAFTVVNDVGQIDWIPEPSWGQLATALQELSGNGGVLLIVGYALALGLALAGWLRMGEDRRSFEGWRYAFLLLWAIGPVAVAFAASFAKPVFISRYLMVAMPGMALAAVAGLTLLKGRLTVLAGAAVAAALAVSGFALADWYDEPGIRWTPHLHQLEHAEPADGMVFYAPTMLRPYLYYAHRMDVMEELPELEYPASYGWPGYSRTRYNPDYDAIGNSAGEHDRMWLIAGVAWDEPRQEEFRKLQETLRDHCPRVIADLREPRMILYGDCS